MKNLFLFLIALSYSAYFLPAFSYGSDLNEGIDIIPLLGGRVAEDKSKDTKDEDSNQVSDSIERTDLDDDVADDSLKDKDSDGVSDILERKNQKKKKKKKVIDRDEEGIILKLD